MKLPKCAILATVSKGKGINFFLWGLTLPSRVFCMRLLPPHALLRQPFTRAQCLFGHFKWVFCVRRILARRIKSSCFPHAHVLAQSQFTFVSPTSGLPTPVYLVQQFNAPGHVSLSRQGYMTRPRKGSSIS